MDLTAAVSPSAPPSAAERYNIPARLERLPMTAYQRKLFVVIATAWLADQVDVALLTFLLASIIAAFHLSSVEAGALASMTFAGQLIGNVLAGTGSDRFGRKVMFQLTMIVWGVASFLAASAWSLGALMVFRLLIGVGVGGEAPVAQAMLSEFMPAPVRGKYIAFMEGFWAVGYVCSGVISFAILPHLGWRWVFVAVGCLSIAIFLVRRFVPESPRWLVDQGRFEDADAVMTSIEHEVERDSGTPLPPPRPFVEIATHVRANPVATLFAPQYRARTLMAFGLWFFALLGFYGLNSWIAVLLKAHGFSIVKSVQFVTLITLGGIPGFAVAAALLERIGRKSVTALFLAASAAAAYLYGTAPNGTALFAWGFVMQFFTFGMWSCLYAYTPELYPTRARSTGAGFASAAGRVGAIIGPNVVPYILATGGQSAVFTLGAASFLLGGALVLILGVETRGKALELISS